MSLWAIRVDQRDASVGLWFAPLPPEPSPEFTARTGHALTAEELRLIASIATRELSAALAATCLHVSDSPQTRYAVRVEPDLPGLVAGQSRSVPGLGGRGALSFSSVAAGAVWFAPPATARESLIAAIGRGIGRTAAHEAAHQLLGSFDLHDSRDRNSYEYPDLRAEHFYGAAHWTRAGPQLQARYGRKGDGCRQ